MSAKIVKVDRIDRGHINDRAIVVEVEQQSEQRNVVSFRTVQLSVEILTGMT